MARVLRPQPAPPPVDREAVSQAKLARSTQLPQPHKNPGHDSVKGGPVAGPERTVSTSTGGTNDNTQDEAAQLAAEQRIAELGDLAMNNDPDSLNTILSELENPNREIRKGALEAAVQFGDRSAIPRLQEIAAQTEDHAERADILAAIDYLKLPSLTEYLAARRASAPSAGQASSRPAFTNRFPGSLRSRGQAPQPLPSNQ